MRIYVSLIFLFLSERSSFAQIQTGTDFAAANVSARAAMIIVENPHLTTSQIKEKLIAQNTAMAGIIGPSSEMDQIESVISLVSPTAEIFTSKLLNQSVIGNQEDVDRETAVIQGGNLNYSTSKIVVMARTNQIMEIVKNLKNLNPNITIIR